MAGITATKVISIATALIGAGGIAALSLFDVPELQSQPADRSLPSLRYLFSRGSHIFPQAAGLSSAGFACLAYSSLPPLHHHTAAEVLREVVRLSLAGGQATAYLAAAVLTISIAPWTALIMVPATNFPLIQLNEDLGGARSAASAAAKSTPPGKKSAEESAMGPGEAGELGDLSGPQTRTARRSSAEEDARARELLANFGRLNMARAVMMAAGGTVGLWAALGS